MSGEGSGGRIHIEAHHRIVADAVRARIFADGAPGNQCMHQLSFLSR